MTSGISVQGTTGGVRGHCALQLPSHDPLVDVPPRDRYGKHLCIEALGARAFMRSTSRRAHVGALRVAGCGLWVEGKGFGCIHARNVSSSSCGCPQVWRVEHLGA